MHRISVFDFFFIPKIHKKHFKSGLTIKIKPRQHVSPLFYTVGTVYSDILCKNVCFLNRFMGMLCSSLHKNSVLLFNEERCAAAYSNVGEILIAAAQWRKILHCKFFNEHWNLVGHFKARKLWLFLELTCDIANTSRAKFDVMTVHFRCTEYWTKICSQGWSWW